MESPKKVVAVDVPVYICEYIKLCVPNGLNDYMMKIEKIC